MKTKVCKDRCFGCGACTAIAPDVFMMDDDGLAKVLIEDNGEYMNVSDNLKSDVESASESCPGSAIEVE